jgi:hypothetical protein
MEDRMNISSPLTALNPTASGGQNDQPATAVTTDGTLDSANFVPASNVLPADVYHGADGPRLTNPLAQGGVGAYITVAKVTDVNSLAVEWLQLSSSGLGNPSGDLRRDYESAVSKLSSELQKKDWGFSVDDGQLVFTQGKDELSTQDRKDLAKAFAATGAAAAAQQIATVTAAMVSVARQLMPTSSTGIGSYDVTTKNFSNVVDLRSYLMSHGPDGKYGQNLVNKSDYSQAYQFSGVYAMFDQISQNAKPNAAA